MNKTRIACAIAGAALAGMTAASMAADRPDYGKREFDSNCAVCHGRLGKGDGPYAGMVDTKGGADITQLTRKNGGVFPIYRVTQTIDGRFQVKAHGPRDMPIWGRDYQIKAGEFYADSYYDPEAFIRGRILALIDYLNRMQAK